MARLEYGRDDDNSSLLGAFEFIIGDERIMEDLLCEVCSKKPAIMTTNYNSPTEGMAWKSICFSCFNKQFEGQKQRDIADG